MSRISIWVKTKCVIESCKTHDQLNVARKMIENAESKSDINYGDEFYKDLMDGYYKKWSEIEDIEDTELLEKMNADIKSKKTTS
jgi:hypothetical protein